MKHLLTVAMLFVSVSLFGEHMFDYTDIKNGKFTEKTIRGVRSMNDGEHYTATDQGRIEKFSYKSGDKTATIFDAAQFDQLAGGFSDYEFDATEKQILLTTNRKPIYRRSATADYWIYDIGAGTLKKLTPEGREQVAVFSPDGKMVGFVRSNNIYVVNLSDYSVKQITTDGEFNHIINGHTDWVYEEEFEYTRAFHFSPDNRRIIYLKSDESMVREYTFMLYRTGLYPEAYTYKYPKAGEKNCVVELYIHDLATGSDTKVDVGPEIDQYIPGLGWTPEGEAYFYRKNRKQNHFEVLVSDMAGNSRVVFEERDPRYIQMVPTQMITFLPKRKLLVKSDRSGNAHLYVHDMDKLQVTDTVTRGNWDMSRLVNVVGDRVYYISGEGNHLQQNLYSVKLNGKGKTRLTTDDGTSRVSPSKGFKYFISYYSNSTTPNLVRLHNSSGKVLRTLEDNAELKKTLATLRVPRKEFFTFTTMQGTTLYGYMIKPNNFDPAKKYPVMLNQYSGPGSQSVQDNWSSPDFLDVLVQEGYIVVCVDGRGTGGRGTEFMKCTYGNLGGLEIEDQIETAKYMATQSYVDPARIGIYGWSYGGFMALNCILKGNDVFKVAISVAPNTTWRYYDTIYTEVHNGLPQENAAGYDDNSPINYAHLLKGKLLLIHGSADDNDHAQSTYLMADALVKAGKQFDMMIYTDDNHSMHFGAMHHIRETMIRYTLENL